MAQPIPSTLPLFSRTLLKRWRTDAPESVAELESSGQLLPFLEQANEQSIDLLYELTVLQKRDYKTALQLAIDWTMPVRRTTQ